MAFIKYNGYCADCKITRVEGIRCSQHPRTTCDEGLKELDNAVTAAGATYLNSESFKVTDFCHLLDIPIPGHEKVMLMSQYEEVGGYY